MYKLHSGAEERTPIYFFFMYLYGFDKHAFLLL